SCVVVLALSRVFCEASRAHRALHSFPTRRSSDLVVLTMSTASSLYADHLATLHERAATALESGGFDHLVVPSGTPHVQVFDDRRSEEHTSELQSRENLVCRLLLEKKNKEPISHHQ